MRQEINEPIIYLQQCGTDNILIFGQYQAKRDQLLWINNIV